jgi:uncharacterized protein with LGFP repeats
VQYARNKGAVLTSAAGNDGCDCRSFPASFPEVISVGASGTTDARTSYSNYGSWVDVAAPGSNYTTTMSGDYASFSGTSSATPVVAGVLGLLRSAAPLASVGAIETALLSTASPVGYVAAGRIDAAAALGAVGVPVPTVTSFPLSGAIGAMYPSVANVLGAPTSVEYAVPGGRGQTFQAGDMLWSASTGAREVHGAIVRRYRLIGGPESSLGLPTTHDSPAGDGVGRFNHFQNGTIISGPATGAQDVRGTIRDRWAAIGWEKSPIGYPTTGEGVTGDGAGRFNHFQQGTIIRGPVTGAQDVRGLIRDRWAAIGWERSPIGYPITGEGVTGDGAGRFNHFQGGTIVWHPALGAQDVRGAIRDRWAAIGWERSPIGYPITGEGATGDGAGRFNHFEQGTIVWHPALGEQDVRGRIRDRWAAIGWERSTIGYPITGEGVTGDRAGRFNHFEQGTIVWTPALGAQDVRGLIRDRWAAIGWERSPIGYPITGEGVTGDGAGRFNHFQGGTIVWTPSIGARDVRGAIRDRWAATGWERGPLGYPVSNEYDVPGGKRNDFQRGSIVWDARTGQTRIV